MHLRSLAILCMMLSLSACSWVTRFAVTNDSADPVTVRYSAEIYLHSQTKMPTCLIEQGELPKVTTDDLWRFNTGAWKPLSPERYHFDRKECSVELVLNPGESVSVAYEGTYTGADAGRGNPGQLNLLSIKGKQGETSFRGQEILRLFNKIDDTLYVYRYKP